MENRVWNSLAVCALVVAFALSDSAATATNQSVTTQAPGENPEHTVAPTVNVTTPPPAPENLKTAPENPKTAPVTNDTISKLPVSIYYEGLCKDSVNFIEKQFTPAYEKLNTYLAVTFIPFSQGKIVPIENSTDSKLVCRRDGECNADIVHTCAIKHITKQDDLVKFITCALTEGIKNATEKIPVEKCGSSSNIDNATVGLINDCVSNVTQYLPLLKVDLDYASDENITYVPTIVFNKTYSDETQKLAETKFLNAVCGALKDKDTPAVCKTIDSGADTVIVGILPMLVGVYYLIRMF